MASLSNYVWRKKRGRSSPPDSNLTQHDILLDLKSTDIVPTGGSAQMAGFQSIASYNWLNSSEPTILIPGSPAIWSPPAQNRRLQPDNGLAFIDQNSARYSSSPLEPMFRAILATRPDYSFEDVDIVICRNTMVKLFDFVVGSTRGFEIDVEMVGSRALFVRREKQNTEIITGFRGFGINFPEEYTRWDSETKGSSSHHRIARFEFAGLTYLLRSECDGYLADKASDIPNRGQSPQQIEDDHSTTSNLLNSSTLLTIGEHLPITARSLITRNVGHEIRQEATIEIKTRAAHRFLDMDMVLPRLWMSQTQNLIIAYHKGNRFDDVRVKDVQNDIKTWETEHRRDLLSLHVLIRTIVDTVRSSRSKKCRIKRVEAGNLQIRELGADCPNALPEDLCERLAMKMKDVTGKGDE